MCHPVQQFANTIVTPGSPPFFHLFYHMTVLLAFFCKDNRPICLHATKLPRQPYLPGRLRGEAAGKLSVSMTFQRQRIPFFWQ